MKTSFSYFLRLFLSLFISIAFVIPAFSQAGSNDATFNSTDQGFGSGDGANGTITAAVIQSDGKIIIAGAFNTYNGTARNYITRLNTDGSLDASFNPGTGPNSTIQTAAIQTDGKIIIAGLFQSFNGTARNNIARLNADGSLDATFNPGTGSNSTIYSIAIQTDGKMVIGGAFTAYNGTGRNNIARLNTDGSLDAVFNPGTGAGAFVYSIVIQSDEKIVIGGAFTFFNSTARSRIARLNTDGSVDASFNPGTGANNIIYATSIQSDGKIIAGGQFTTFNGSARNSIVRLNTDGSLDAGFNPGTGANNTIRTTAIQSDGKIIVGGLFTFYNGTVTNRIARLNTDGSLDAGFNSGPGANNTIFVIAIQSNGQVIMGGLFTVYDDAAPNRIARLNTDGSLDTNFNFGTGANNIIYTTALQGDGKIVSGGDFTGYNGISRTKIARLNADGSVDASFNPGTGANNSIRTTAIQSDGKILIGGVFTSYNGTTINRIARLNADGSLDAGFIPGTAANSTIYTISIQSDGKIIIGGAFISYNGTAVNNIARLNSDGSLDAGFTISTGSGSTIYTSSIQSDGKIIIGGDFSAYNGTARSKIARLNADGSLDASFNPGTGANSTISTTSIQSDGKVVIGGAFTTFNGTPRNYIARLNTDGSLDAGFNPGTGANNVIYTTAIQGDSKIIVGGFFTTFNGTVKNRIARLNTDGSMDASFIAGTGANNTIRTTSIQSDGKIIIGGDFTAYNGTGRNRIARVIAGGGGTSTYDYFRSITSGNWNSPATWESSPVADFSSGVISPATLAPDFNANAITIRGPHTVTVTANVVIDQTTVATGGNLIVKTGVTLTVK
ncbi:MAG: delta-60 repeat domain-containing protein [Chitinophagaceae bacterium]